MAIFRNPWMGRVTLTNANTAYQISALFTGMADAQQPQFFLRGAWKVKYISLQADINAGAAIFYLGNETLTTSNYGIALVGGQAWQAYFLDAPLSLDDLWVGCDTAGQKISLAVISA